MSGPLGTPVQGVTLYSFTRPFHAREHDLESLLRAVAAEGLGPGLEMVGFGSLRGFPRLAPGFSGWFRDLVGELGLVPSALSINADIGLRRDRLLTQDELVEYMRAQIRAAAELGFPLARVQISLSPDSMERLAPVAEEHGVVLALEVHADQYAAHPRIRALRERYEQLGSPFLGFTMDWGATVSGFAPSLLEAYRRRGAPEAFCTAVVARWEEFARLGPPADQREHGERFGRFVALAAEHGRPDLGVDVAIAGTGLFGPAPVDGWREIAPWIRHVHAKFFGIDADGQEPSVPVADLVELLVRQGYSGAVSSEYEGWHWNHWDDPFALVRAEQALQRAAAEAAGSRVVVDADRARALLHAPVTART
ncbi:sugar phosphate isomerase/epimerase family protein [Kineococcus sp. SYSU DK002]|uniref:sugar phosphate isomerase/epimerase family protein n=1 Tax=Kineococcus sp. SYSU DK002 TaxID=3383123 RepID=UPI003D7E80E9